MMPMLVKVSETKAVCRGEKIGINDLADFSSHTSQNKYIYSHMYQQTNVNSTQIISS